MFSPKPNTKFCFFNIKHIAICMCNSIKCWFKHPLPYMDTHPNKSTYVFMYVLLTSLVKMNMASKTLSST